MPVMMTLSHAIVPRVSADHVTGYQQAVWEEEMIASQGLSNGACCQIGHLHGGSTTRLGLGVMVASSHLILSMA